ncbi:MAG: nitroreductase family protein [Bacteroidales bacterium]|nr:nitroreductase family protein [Bacteroidales bacterium]
MKFIELVEKRQSDRKYIQKKITDNDIYTIIEAARLAPSASNSQPWTFIVVKDENIKKQLAEATISKGLPINKFAYDAAIIIAIVIEKAKTLTRLAGWIKKRDFPWIDIGIAAEHICLQATELGIGSCIIGWFDEKKVKQILHVPSNKRIGLLITLGYTPNDYYHRQKVRKSMDKVLKFNSY